MVTVVLAEGLESAIVSSNDDGARLLSLPTDRWIQHQNVAVRRFPRWSQPVQVLREFAFTLPSADGSAALSEFIASVTSSTGSWGRGPGSSASI